MTNLQKLKESVLADINGTLDIMGKGYPLATPALKEEISQALDRYAEEVRRETLEEMATIRPTYIPVSVEMKKMSQTLMEMTKKQLGQS